MMIRECVAEAIGTFALVFAGTGAIVINDVSAGAVSHVGIALTFGLVIMSMIYAIGNISGAHINPAVTIGFCVTRSFPAGRAFFYIVSQISGAVLASLIIRLLFANRETIGATLPFGPVWQSAVLEFLLTFLLMFVVISVSRGVKEEGFVSGIAIGGMVALEALFAGPISGASMNPARSFAPALVSGHLEHLWVYILSPISGAILGGLSATFILGRKGQ